MFQLTQKYSQNENIPKSAANADTCSSFSHISSLDYCNSLYYGADCYVSKQLQMIQNSIRQRQRLGAVFFGKLCGTASAQKGIFCGQVQLIFAKCAARCGEFLQNVRPLCSNFMQIVR